MLHETGRRKIGRNDPCPCGSGLKYKKCCMNKEEHSGEPVDVKRLYAERYRIRLKESPDVEGIKMAGRLVVDTLDLAESHIRAGIKTDEINTKPGRISDSGLFSSG